MKTGLMKVFFIAAGLFFTPLAHLPTDALALEAGAATGGTVADADALAKVGDLDRALTILDAILAKEPGNTGAKLLYARTLSWKGEYDRAVPIYRELVLTEPDNAEAAAGYARVLSWKGEYGRSVEEFRRSLKIAPGSAETRTSLARTLWWKGDVDGALKELSTVLAKDPGYKEALSLERRLRQDNGPALKASYANSSDSDDNRLEAFRLTFTGTFGLPGHRFEAGYRLYDASLASRGASAHFLDLKDSIRLFGKSVITPRLSLVSLDSDKNSVAYFTEGLSFSTTVAKGTGLSLSYSRYPLVDTVTLIENNIRVREAALAMTHETRGVALLASASHASYSDGNSRYDLSGALSVNVLKSPRVAAGFASEYREYEEKTANGYFNPPGIFSNTVFIDASGRPHESVVCRAKASLGNQSYEGRSEYATSFQAGLEWEAARDLSIEAAYKYSKSALESASGFRFEEFRFGVNYLF